MNREPMAWVRIALEDASYQTTVYVTLVPVHGRFGRDIFPAIDRAADSLKESLAADSVVRAVSGEEK